jgi:hypothetical protein
VNPHFLPRKSLTDQRRNENGLAKISPAPRSGVRHVTNASETVIQGCKSKDAGETQLRLRRPAIGIIADCKLSAPLVAQASKKSAGADAPIPPRFIACLVTDIQSDAAKNLAKDGLVELPHAAPPEPIYIFARSAPHAAARYLGLV